MSLIDPAVSQRLASGHRWISWNLGVFGVNFSVLLKKQGEGFATVEMTSVNTEPIDRDEILYKTSLEMFESGIEKVSRLHFPPFFLRHWPGRLAILV